MTLRTKFNSHSKPTLPLCNQDQTENQVWPGSAPACSVIQLFVIVVGPTHKKLTHVEVVDTNAH